MTHPRNGEISQFTDHYFNRTKQVIGKFRDATVTYAVFMRRPVGFAPRGPAWACYAAASLPDAELPHLDVMLLVTSLRWRSGADNVQSDYAQFGDHNRGVLSAASQSMRDDLAGPMGAARASAEMDKLSVMMANHYGNGTGIGCHELRMIAQDLGSTREPAALADAAEALVGEAALEQACSADLARRRCQRKT